MAKKVERDTLVETNKRWLTPVETAQDLPQDDVRDGDICFVNSEQRSWTRVDGEWQPKQKG